MLSQIKGLITGGTKVTKIGDLVVDACISRTPRYSAIVTEHPVEHGSVIADHHQVMPVEITIEGAMVRTSLGNLFPGQTVVNSVKSFVTGGDPLIDAQNLLIDYINDHEMLSISTPKYTLDDMMITDLSFPDTQDLGDRMKFEVTCKYVKIVYTGLAGLLALGKDVAKKAKEQDGNGADSSSNQAKPEANEGKATTTDTTSAESTKSRSILDGLLF